MSFNSNRNGIHRLVPSRSTVWLPVRVAILLLALTPPAYGGYRIALVAGGTESGFAGDGGPATEALLDHPAALTYAADGTLYIADTGNNRVRTVDADGVIRTVAGNGTPGSSGDGGPAVDAELHSPQDVAVDSDGNLFIVDGSPTRVRRVDASTGVMSTFLGAGFADYAVANDSQGNIYVTLSPVFPPYGSAYVLAFSPWESFRFDPIPVANLLPYDVAAANPREVLVVLADYVHAVARQDGRILWRYDPEVYSVTGPFGIALTERRRLYLTASTFYSGASRLVMRSRGLRLSSVAGGGAGEVGEGAAADTVNLDAAAIAVDNDGVVHVVHRPSQVVALVRGPKYAGRILGTAESFPGSRFSSFSPGYTSIFVQGDNGVFRFTQPNSRGRFVFSDLPPGRYTVYARYDEEGFSCDAQNCGWSGAPNDCPRSLNDAVVEVTAGDPRHRVGLYLLDSFPCI